MNLLMNILRLGRCLSPALGWRLGRGLGALYAACGGRDIKRAEKHLQQAFPQAHPSWCQAQARRCCMHMGGMALETLSSLGSDPRRLARGIRVEGREHLRDLYRASRAGQGSVAFTAHFGNWELLSRLFAPLLPISLIGRRLRWPSCDAAVKWLRTHTGAQQIDQQEGLRPVRQALRDGRVIACLADQDVPALAGVFVPWFGSLAYTPSGPAMLCSLVPGTALQVVLCMRRGRTWCVHFGPRWPLPEGDRAAAILALTARATAYVEALVRRRPEQWVWWHKRWRTRPEQRPHAAVWGAASQSVR